MLKSTFAQLTIKFLVLSQNCIYFASPFYFVYLDSWVKTRNPSISYSKMFWCLTLYDSGIPLANYLVPALIPLVGLRGTLQLAGPLVLIACLLYFAFSSLWVLYLTALVVGISHQFFVISILEMINQKYEKHFLLYMGRVFSAVSITRALYNLVSLYVINPNNRKPDLSVVIEGNREYYFPREVTSRFPNFLVLVAGVNLLTSTVGSFLLTDPTYPKSKLHLFLSGVTNKGSLPKKRTACNTTKSMYLSDTRIGDSQENKHQRLFYSEYSHLKNDKFHKTKDDLLIPLNQVLYKHS